MKIPVRRNMCPTCPFRDDVEEEYAQLRDGLTKSALTETSRICHSTGKNALRGRTGKPSALCRGARDVQLRFFTATGVIAAPTDSAWNAECRRRGIKPNQR